MVIRHKKLTKKDNEILDQLQALRQERSQIKKQFQQALDKAEADIIIMTDKVEALKKDKADIYTLFVLDQVDASAYTDVEKALQDAEDALKLTNNKIVNIREIEIQEVNDKIYPKIAEIERNFYRINSKNDVYIKHDLLEAKKEYLKKVSQSYKPKNIMNTFHRFIEDMEVFTGRKENGYSYIRESEEAEQFLTSDFTGEDGADVSPDEFRAAFK